MGEGRSVAERLGLILNLTLTVSALLCVQQSDLNVETWFPQLTTGNDIACPFLQVVLRMDAVWQVTGTH